jgi:hypothetical protein
LKPSGRGEQSKGGRGAHGFGNVDQEALEAEKDPTSAAPATEEGAEAEAAAEPIVEAEPEPGTLQLDPLYVSSIHILSHTSLSFTNTDYRCPLLTII